MVAHALDASAKSPGERMKVCHCANPSPYCPACRLPDFDVAIGGGLPVRSAPRPITVPPHSQVDWTIVQDMIRQMIREELDKHAAAIEASKRK